MIFSAIKWAFRLAFPLLLALVTYETVTPDPGEPAGASLANWIAVALFNDDAFADKVGHFMAYASLSGALTLAQYASLRTSAIGVAALALYGAALEGVQGLSPNRYTDLWDGAANAAGGVCAYLIGAALVLAMRRVALRSEED
ncbi:MAG: hypothetical protein AAFX08_01165 [Pseudomonadota bacterium]